MAAAWGWIVLALAAALSRLWRRRSRKDRPDQEGETPEPPSGGFLGFGPELVEPAVCFRCGRDGFRRYGKDGFQLVICPECTQAFVSPRLTEEGRLELYGDPDYHEEGVYGSGSARRLQRTWIRGRLDLIEDALEGGEVPSVFEIGCGYGPFLGEARERGFSVGGLEYSSFAAGKAGEELGVEIHVGEVEHLDTGDDRYDAVAFWDVLEHVPDPAAFMRKVVGITAPGGVVALSCPYFDSLPARLLRARWWTFKPHKHIWHFTTDTLLRLLRESGLDPLAVVKNPWGRANRTRLDSLVVLARKP
jgi:SAM-dependent methyltransferase